MNFFIMKGLILSILLFISTIVHGQFVIGEGVSLKIDNIVTTDGSLNNEGSLVWDINSRLYLTGDGELQTMDGSTLNNLKINGAYQLHNSIIVVNSLALMGGTITPVNNSQLLLLNSANITSENGAYVAGNLYHQGTGEKFYPLGKNQIYTPVILTDVQGEEEVIVGVEAFNESLDVNMSVQDWYWQITTQGNFDGSLIQLPLLDTEGMAFTVLQSDGANALDLGGNLVNGSLSVESQLQGIGPYFLLGSDSEEDLALTIHNIVTPDRKDGKNDAFYIENIERYEENTVIIMTRWGSEICRIENFSNDPEDQKGCDLERISAGNYICVVEYDGKRSTPVLITILK